MMYSLIESAPQRPGPGPLSQFAAEVHLRGGLAPLPHEIRQDAFAPAPSGSGWLIGLALRDDRAGLPVPELGRRGRPDARAGRVRTVRLSAGNPATRLGRHLHLLFGDPDSSGP